MGAVDCKPLMLSFYCFLRKLMDAKPPSTGSRAVLHTFACILISSG